MNTFPDFTQIPFDSAPAAVTYGQWSERFHAETGMTSEQWAFKTLEQIDLIELNEAFASQSVACIRELDLDPERVNVDGGAIALGHPLGASGGRLVTTLVHSLRRTGGRYGLATMCIGVGQGIAMVIERI